MADEIEMAVRLSRRTWDQIAAIVKRLNEQGIETTMPELVDKLCSIGTNAVLADLASNPKTAPIARELANAVRGRRLARRPRQRGA